MAGNLLIGKPSGGTLNVIPTDGTTNTDLVLPASGTVLATDVNGNVVNLKTQDNYVSPFTGFKNYIINGNFDVWQRGTSQTSSGYGSADRWFSQFDGDLTVSHELVSYNNTARLSWTSAGTYKNFLTSVEDGARKLQGKTLTLSFIAKASTAGICSTYVGRGQGAGISAVIDSVTINLTTSWQKFTRTFTMPTYDNSNMTLVIGLISMQLLGNSNTVWIEQVQLEEGSVATPFENRPYGLELSLCQRYYETNGTARCEEFRNPIVASTQYGAVRFNVQKRISPTVTVYSDNFNIINNVAEGNGNNIPCTLASIGNTGFRLSWTNSSSTIGASFRYTASAEL